MAELLKVREITIDTMQYKDFATKEEELKVMRFYQNDLNSAKLLINVTHDKVVTDFSTATKVQIAFLKPDGKRVFQDVQNVNQMQGKYYVVLSTQTLIAYGNVIAQLRLTFPNNKVIETCKFVFAVDESIMSDEAMESTNEFPVIQKAIEAGEKLEGVDINGIIAAGELAKGALPKTGGTLTGDLFIEGKEAGKHKGLMLKHGAHTFYQTVSETGEMYSYDSKGVTPFKYSIGTNFFDMRANTNLLKKTGDIMTGDLKMSNGRSLRLQNAADQTIMTLGSNSGGGFYSWSDVAKKGVFKYDPVTNFMEIQADTNVVKKSGDTVSGDLAIDRANTSTYRELKWSTGGVNDILLGQDTSGNWRAFDATAGAGTIFRYDKATKRFTVDVANTNLVKSTGDTITGEVVMNPQATIRYRMPLTASARGFRYQDETSQAYVAGLGFYRSSDADKGMCYMGWGETPWAQGQSLAVGENVFKYKGKDIAFADKNGTATPPLTTDGEALAGAPFTVVRRGNTVSISGAARRKAGATGDTVVVLPADLRPVSTVRTHVIATDGTLVFMSISSSSGNIAFDKSGKDIYLNITYVVD